MAYPQRQLTAAIWKQILWKNGESTFLILGVVWGMYVAGLLGFEMRTRGQRIVDALPRENKIERESSDPVRLKIAIAVSLVVGVSYGFRVNRARILARRGVPTAATMRRVSGVVDFAPLRRGMFSYMFEDNAYSWKSWGVEQRTPGAAAGLLVDPSKPSRAMFRSDVLPHGTITLSPDE